MSTAENAKVEILDRVREWAGSEAAALAWFTTWPIPGFGALTAEDLVRSGRAEAVKRYLSEVGAGGYA